MKIYKIEFTKFIIVGITNTVFTGIIYYYLFKIAHINYLIAFSISWLIGITYSYLCNFIWVFKPGLKILNIKIFLRYFLANGLSFLFNIFLLKMITDFTKFDPFYIQILLIPLVVIINFLSSKFYSLKTNL